MYHEFPRHASFWAFLFSIDQDIAESARPKKCPCGGHLHRANYPRKPRGGGDGFSEQYGYRLSFCCEREGCRTRVTPPSVRFLGWKVYLGAVVVLVAAMRQGPSPRPASHSRPGEARAEKHRLDREIRSYEAEYVGSLWHLDFHHGSLKVLTSRGQWQRPLALGILDDHSRLCCHLQWYVSETAEDLVHGLSQASDVLRPSPSSSALRDAFRMEGSRTQRTSDGTVSVEGVRFEIPTRYRHFRKVAVRYARWDLSRVDLVDPRRGTVLSLSSAGKREGTMPGVDFSRLRAEITMEQVLNLLHFEPSHRTGHQWYGDCPLHDSPSRRQNRLQPRYCLFPSDSADGDQTGKLGPTGA